jgi:hypothetical protein
MQMRKGHRCFEVGGPQLYMCGEKGCCLREGDMWGSCSLEGKIAGDKNNFTGN